MTSPEIHSYACFFMGVYVPCCNFTTKYHQFVSIEVRLFDVDVVSQGQGVRALLGHLDKTQATESK